MALRVVELLAQGVTPQNEASLSLLGDDGKRYEIEFDQACAALVGATLLTVAGEIQSKSPSESGQAQMIRGVGFQPAILDTGEVALVLSLEGGAELVVAIPAEAVAPAVDSLQEMAAAARPRN